MNKLNGTLYVQIKSTSQCDFLKGNPQTDTQIHDGGYPIVWFVSNDGTTTKKYQLYKAPKWLRDRFADYTWDLL